MCPFCNPDSRRIVSESQLTWTVFDAFPVSPGHALVVPKRHIASPFDATDNEMAEIWKALRKIADLLIANPPEACRKPDGFNIGVNCGQAAGQTVMHVHWHLIPRYAGDQPDARGGIRRIFPDLADYWSNKE
jgi:diadenosine tetraphosphate (Ap4A) HIT family hydrolase